MKSLQGKVGGAQKRHVRFIVADSANRTSTYFAIDQKATVSILILYMKQTTDREQLI